MTSGIKGVINWANFLPFSLQDGMQNGAEAFKIYSWLPISKENKMKRGIQWFVTVMVIGLLVLSGCSTGQPKASVATSVPSTSTQPANLSSQSGQPGNNQAGSNPVGANPAGNNPGGNFPGGNNPSGTDQPGANTTRVVRATATPTTTVSAATSTPAPATATPAVFPTAAISSVGKMSLPDKATALTFPDNASTSAIDANLVTHQPVAYTIQAKAGQVVQIAVNGETNLQVFGPNKNPVSNVMVMPGYVSLTLADAGTYTIGLDGLGKVIMSVYLPGASDNLASAAPVPANAAPVAVPAMPFSVFVESKLSPGVNAGYTFNGKAGEMLTLAMQYNVVPVLLAPDGNTLVPDTSAIDHSWLYALPEDGSYTLVMLGTSYSIVQIKVTAMPTATAAAAPSGATRIAIPSGKTSVSFRTYFTANKSQTYVINSGNGLSMTVSISGSAQISKMTGPDGKDVAPVHSLLSGDWSAKLGQSGDYTLVLSGSGPSTITFTIPLNNQVTPYVTPTY
jgi:hypothetical protein